MVDKIVSVTQYPESRGRRVTIFIIVRASARMPLSLQAAISEHLRTVFEGHDMSDEHISQFYRDFDISKTGLNEVRVTHLTIHLSEVDEAPWLDKTVFEGYVRDLIRADEITGSPVLNSVEVYAIRF